MFAYLDLEGVPLVISPDEEYSSFFFEKKWGKNCKIFAIFRFSSKRLVFTFFFFSPRPWPATLVAGHWTLDKGLDIDKLDSGNWAEHWTGHWTGHWTKDRTNGKGSEIEKLDIGYRTLDTI